MAEHRSTDAGSKRYGCVSRARRLAALLLIVSLLPMWAANASGAPNPVDREVHALVAALGASRCRFERNGTWHDAAAAQAHLLKKYAYLRKRNLVPSTDVFIERGASQSSASGKPYRVQCGAAAPVASAVWLRMRLAALRGPTAPSR